MPGWMNHKLESRLLREVSATSDKNLRYANDSTQMAESKKELKSLLIRVKDKRVKKLA